MRCTCRAVRPRVDVEMLHILVGEGRTAREIAEALGVTTRTVLRYKQDFGLTRFSRPPVVMPEGWEDRAVVLFAEGYSQSAVAEITGVHVGTVARHFPGKGWSRSESGRYARQIRVLNTIQAHAA
jgi:DNA-binding CsgD family transcriptional regulator